MSKEPRPLNDDPATAGVVAYEGAPGRVSDGARDGSYEFLRREDRPDAADFVRPRRRWLSQGPEGRLSYIDEERRRAALNATPSTAVSPAMAELTSEAGLTARVVSATELLNRYTRLTSAAAKEAFEAARFRTQNIPADQFGHAEQNLNAAFELAQKLVRARDVQEAMELQAEFVRNQLAALQVQAKELGGLAESAPLKEAQRIRATLRQGAEEARRTMEHLHNAASDPA